MIYGIMQQENGTGRKPLGICHKKAGIWDDERTPGNASWDDMALDDSDYTCSDRTALRMQQCSISRSSHGYGRELNKEQPFTGKYRPGRTGIQHTGTSGYPGP